MHVHFDFDDLCNDFITAPPPNIASPGDHHPDRDDPTHRVLNLVESDF